MRENRMKGLQKQPNVNLMLQSFELIKIESEQQYYFDLDQNFPL